MACTPKLNKPTDSIAQLRVEDAAASKRFFCEGLGMAQAVEKHFEKAAFSLFFLATPAEAAAAEGAEHALDTKKQWAPALELTHNHGTELPGNVGEKYASGSDRKFMGKVGFEQSESRPVIERENSNLQERDCSRAPSLRSSPAPAKGMCAERLLPPLVRRRRRQRLAQVVWPGGFDRRRRGRRGQDRRRALADWVLC